MMLLTVLFQSILHLSLRLPFAVDIFISVRETGWPSQLFFFLSTDRESYLREDMKEGMKLVLHISCVIYSRK